MRLQIKNSLNIILLLLWKTISENACTLNNIPAHPTALKYEQSIFIVHNSRADNLLTIIRSCSYYKT